MVYTRLFSSKRRTMQDNEGHFGGFCRSILTLNEGQCMTISTKIAKNAGEYGVPAHTPIKNKSNFNCYDTLLLVKTVKVM